MLGIALVLRYGRIMTKKRETRLQLAARIRLDNARAALLPEGLEYHDSLFGPTVLGPVTIPGNPEEGTWDVYRVTHSGFEHQWSSAAVIAAFRRAVVA